MTDEYKEEHGQYVCLAEIEDEIVALKKQIQDDIKDKKHIEDGEDDG